MLIILDSFSVKYIYNLKFIYFLLLYTGEFLQLPSSLELQNPSEIILTCLIIIINVENKCCEYFCDYCDGLFKIFIKLKNINL